MWLSITKKTRIIHPCDFLLRKKLESYTHVTPYYKNTRITHSCDSILQKYYNRDNIIVWFYITKILESYTHVTFYYKRTRIIYSYDFLLQKTRIIYSYDFLLQKTGIIYSCDFLLQKNQYYNNWRIWAWYNGRKKSSELLAAGCEPFLKWLWYKNCLRQEIINKRKHYNYVKVIANK